MALVFETVDSWSRPRVICDECEQPVGDGHGMAVYEDVPDGQASGVGRTLHCHKEMACQARARRRVGHTDPMGPWDELADHFLMALAGAGVLFEDLADRWDWLARRGMLPPRRVAAEEE